MSDPEILIFTTISSSGHSPTDIYTKIPSIIRDRLGLRKGEKLIWGNRDGVVFFKVVSQEEFENLRRAAALKGMKVLKKH